MRTLSFVRLWMYSRIIAETSSTGNSDREVLRYKVKKRNEVTVKNRVLNSYETRIERDVRKYGGNIPV